MHYINAGNAAELARKRWDAARQAKLLPPPEEHVLKQDMHNPVNQEVTCTREQIERLNRLIDDCDDAREWDALTRAKERLFRIWAHLAQLPGPGQLKPSAARPQARRMPDPIPLAGPVSSSVQAIDTQGGETKS